MMETGKLNFSIDQIISLMPFVHVCVAPEFASEIKLINQNTQIIINHDDHWRHGIKIYKNA